MTSLFQKFWAASFNISIEDYRNPQAQSTSTGGYVDRYQGKYVFLFKDLQTGKEITAGTPEKIRVVHSLNLIYNDIDFVFQEWSQFRPSKHQEKFQALTKKDEQRIRTFERSISEGDKDTLDLTFEDEIVLAAINQETQGILGIARAGKIKSHPEIVDITVVIGENARGQGLGLKLVSSLFEELRRQDLTPRYRVNEDLQASIRIAERLGMSRTFQIRTFE